MSTSRGSVYRKRPQKHQNKTAFKNDLHDTSHQTKFINSLQVSGVCKRCKNIIEWKIKYKKYKPLAAARKCVGCEQKTIKFAYHVFCRKCVAEKKVCAKCCQPITNEDSAEDQQSTDIKNMLKGLPERKRRTILRYLNKEQDSQQKTSPEIMSNIEDMLAKMDKFDLDDDDDDDGLNDVSDDDLNLSNSETN